MNFVDWYNIILLCIVCAFAMYYFFMQQQLDSNLKASKRSYKSLQQQMDHLAEELGQQNALMYKFRQEIETENKKLIEFNTHLTKEVEELTQVKADYEEKERRFPENYETDDLIRLLSLTLNEKLPADDKAWLNELQQEKLSYLTTVRLKALFSKQNEDWQAMVGYWQVLLADDNDIHKHQAILHMAYGSYQLAKTSAMSQEHLQQATAWCERIMVEAPEYFDDVYGYDDEYLPPEDAVLTRLQIQVYKQVGELLNWIDELRNYQSIHQLARSYAKQGKDSELQDCIEQMALVYDNIDLAQLVEDKDFKSIIDKDWFIELQAARQTQTKKESESLLATV